MRNILKTSAAIWIAVFFCAGEAVSGEPGPRIPKTIAAPKLPASASASTNQDGSPTPQAPLPPFAPPKTPDSETAPSAPASHDFKPAPPPGVTLSPHEPPLAAAMKAQDIHIGPGSPVQMPLSLNELNLILLPSPVASVYTKQPIDVTIEQDKAFVSFSTANPAELYITLKSGPVYSLRLIPKDRLPAQTIRIIPSATMLDPAKHYFRAQEYTTAITRLIEQILSNDTTGFIASTKNTSLDLWEELSVTLDAEWHSPTFKVEIFTVSNKTEHPIHLNEAHWNLPGVRAVVIEQPALKTLERTRLWRVSTQQPDAESTTKQN